MTLSRRTHPFLLLTLAVLVGCSGSAAPSGSTSGSSGSGGAGGSAAPPKAPELGTGDHTPSSVSLVEIATATSKLKTPRDLAFNPRTPDELWVVNLGDESVTIVHGAPDDTRTSEHRKDGYALHFMAKPAALAFGADETTFGLPGTFATCGESRNTYDGQAAPDDFMGPALWSSDLSIFAKKDPNGLGSHLDMLHNSPNCMGIAHQEANVYWTFDGLYGSLSKYDFKKDNGIGNDDHSDGTTYQFILGQVKYAKGVPSHVVYRPEDKMLYVADSGNGRVAKLDTTSGKAGKLLPKSEPQGTYREMTGATIVDVVPSGGALQVPSGLKIKNDMIYVTDNATGFIAAYSLDGERLNELDTGLGAGALAGLEFGPDGKIYFVDMKSNRVLRIDPK